MKGFLLMPELGYVAALLRHFRPEFDDFPEVTRWPEELRGDLTG